MRFLKVFILFLFLPLSASAQFYVTGDDPGKLKWNYIDTESYRIIYPQGADSLARLYGRKLEKYKIPVSRTSGYVTGEGDGEIMPVVIHAYNDANGSVAWSPKRMDLFTIPSAYDPEPMPWSTMLSVHESRHVTQMQFGMTEKHKPGKWFLGQGWNIITFLLYPGTAKTEGDAVIVETALTPSGRGRTADFLNYFWVAFDQGDFRDWFEWRFVSQKRFSPTYYALGYMTIGGLRYIHDYPYLVSDGLHTAAMFPGKIGCLYDVTKKISGKKWNDAWLEVCDTMYAKWKMDADRRKPYIPSERVLPESERYTDYSGNLVVGSDIYTIKSGHVNTPTLVRIDKDGKEHRINSFAAATGPLKWDESSRRLFWSETVPDKRWTLKSDSKIRYLNIGDGRHNAVPNKAMLHNPEYHDGMFAAVRYKSDGHSSMSILNAADGKSMYDFDAPDSLQLVEAAWIGKTIYATGISDNGYGIYTLDVDRNSEKYGEWRQLLAPIPVMIKDFTSYGDMLIFACDRTGVNELYHLTPATGEVRQKTSTRYGASDFQYSEDGQTLYYSSQTLMGKHLFSTPADSLLDKKVQFDSLYRYPIAEKMKEQELAAAKAQGYASSVTVRESDVRLSDPKPYRKVPHIFNLHTWFPAYVSVDNIMNMSFDKVWQAISLGVSGVTQNHLSTAVGEFGYSAHKDPYNASRWRHSGHIKFTYSGLYPVFRLSFDINDRGARQYTPYTYLYKDGTANIELRSRELDIPYINGNIQMYIPFNFTSGGWHRGFIPSISYRISNDRFNTAVTTMQMEQKWTDIDGEMSPSSYPVFIGNNNGQNRIRQSISGSLRAYSMLPVANSAVYSRWGIGVEAGVYSTIESTKFLSPMGYLYCYGYVPGITRTHGIKLTALWQETLRKKSYFSQNVVNTMPRGLADNAVAAEWLALHNNRLVKVTADYAVPIYIGDITIGGNWLAIKRLVAYPHFDYTFIGKQGLWSAGLDITADLHAIITLEWPCSFGVSFSWNGGSAWNSITNNGISMNRWFIGPVFNVSF